MKKLTIAFCLIPFITLTLIGQPKSKKVDILWGQEQKESKKSTLDDIVGYDDNGFYAVKTQRKGLYGLNSKATIEYYNNEMNLVNSVEIVHNYAKKDLTYEFIVQVNDELYLFSSFRNQKLKRNILFAGIIDKKTLRLSSDVKKIAEIDYEGKSKFNAGDFNYALSRDSSKVLIYYDLPFRSGKEEKFGFHVFGSDLHQLWEKEITLPYTDNLFEVEDYQVDVSGNVHLLGQLFDDVRREKRKGESNYTYQVLSFFNEGTKMKQYPVKIEGKFLTDMQIAVNSNQDIICAGFYSDEGTTSILGAYFLRINGETKEISAKAFKEFDLDFITQNMTQKEERKAERKSNKGKDVELYEYELDEIILRSDGGAVLIGEQFFVKIVKDSRYVNGKWEYSTNYYYNFNDVIVISISPTGNIEWAEKIAKRQSTKNDGGFYSSYTHSVVNDKLYFVFNDHPKNLFYKGSGKVEKFNKNSKESLVVLVELDTKGNQTREALFSTREADIITRPKVCEQTSYNEMILFGQRKKMHRFAKITFSDQSDIIRH